MAFLGRVLTHAPTDVAADLWVAFANHVCLATDHDHDHASREGHSSQNQTHD